VRRTSPSARAADLSTVLLVGIGTAAWTGLALGQIGRFRLLPVVLAGLLALVAAARPRRAAAPAPGPGAERGRGFGLDALAVLALAAAFYAPGYDTTLYGADATVYLASGAHLARTGSLAVDDELVARLSPGVARSLFAPQAVHEGSPILRSTAGLVYRRGSRVYSTYSQLPSVMLGIGFAAGGVPGALLVTPLLAAAGVMALYAFARRLWSLAPALLAAGLLTPLLPQLAFARLPMGEAGGQFFLWSGLVAYARWHDTGRGRDGLAAGLGLGLATLARPESALFTGLGMVLLWASSRRGAALFHRPGLAVAAGLHVHFVALLMFVVPSHYRVMAHDLLGEATRALAAVDLRAWAGTGIGALLLVLGWRRVLRGRPVPAHLALRALALAAVVLWLVFYARLDPSPMAGLGPATVRFFVGWPTLALAAVGSVVFAARAWRDQGARLAILVCGTAAVHLLYDPHTTSLALWGARRLVPAILPLVSLCAAAAVLEAGRFARPVALAAAVAALVTNALPSRDVWARPYFRGSSDVAAEVASLFPPRAVVLVDPGIGDAHFDVALSLVHRLNAVQLRTSVGDPGPLQVFPLFVPEREVYLLRPAALADPVAPEAPLVPAFAFEPAGSRRFLLSLPPRPREPHRAGRVYLREVAVKAFRVVPEGG
jgi:hypothetical protein